jgi:hypothetical protein
LAALAARHFRSDCGCGSSLVRKNCQAQLESRHKVG